MRLNQTVIPMFFLCFAFLCFTLIFLLKSYVFFISLVFFIPTIQKAPLVCIMAMSPSSVSSTTYHQHYYYLAMIKREGGCARGWSPCHAGAVGSWGNEHYLSRAPVDKRQTDPAARSCFWRKGAMGAISSVLRAARSSARSRDETCLSIYRPSQAKPLHLQKELV